MDVAILTLGGAGLFIGALSFWRLRLWERQLADARIAVAYKQKVRLQAPLIEWLMWANQLAKDEKSTGRVVYRQANTSVAILKPRPGHGKTKVRTIREKQS